MIIKLQQGADEAQVSELITWLQGQDIEIHRSEDKDSSLIGLIGNIKALNKDLIASLGIVKDVITVKEPFKNANRKFHPNGTIVDVSGVKIGGGHFATMAGPCSVESREQVIETALKVKAAGANLLRGGAYKPRTSPYSFQGMGPDGIELLLEAKRATGLPIVSEIMDASQIQYFEEVDMLQIGARNMQNFTLLKEVGKLRKPVLLKRGLCAT